MIFPKRASHHLISLAGVAYIDVQSRDESFKLVAYEQLLMSLTADDCGKKNPYQPHIESHRQASGTS